MHFAHYHPGVEFDRQKHVLKVYSMADNRPVPVSRAVTHYPGGLRADLEVCSVCLFVCSVCLQKKHKHIPHHRHENALSEGHLFPWS
jgi:hypothetical protein